MKKPPTTNCRSCGAPILWIKLRNRKGETKPHPVDVDPERRIVLVELDHCATLAPEVEGRIEPTYASHFATCPNAASHRRGRR